MGQWKDRLNISSAHLEKWLVTEQSKSVGDAKDGESKGHRSTHQGIPSSHQITTYFNFQSLNISRSNSLARYMLLQLHIQPQTDLQTVE